MTHTLAAACALALASSALAQIELVLPAAHEFTWGRTSTSLLGGNSTRTQLVYASPIPLGAVLTGVGFRCAPSTIDRAAFTADMEIRCSSGPNAPGALNSTFAANVGSDEVIVLPQQTVNIPAMPANRGTGLYAEIPFSTPFVFGLNGNTNLVIEVQVFARSASASWSTDRTFASANGRAATAGIGCGSATINSGSTGGIYVPGSTVNVTIAGAPATTIALLVPTLDQKDFVPGLPLPFDLAAIGAATGCDLLVSPQSGALTFLTDAAGAATASIGIPATFTQSGLGFQWVYLVPPSVTNPAGFETTASRATYIGPEVCVPNYQYVWDLFSATAATGSATTDSIPTCKLIWQ